MINKLLNNSQIYKILIENMNKESFHDSITALFKIFVISWLILSFSWVTKNYLKFLVFCLNNWNHCYMLRNIKDLNSRWYTMSTCWRNNFLNFESLWLQQKNILNGLFFPFIVISVYIEVYRFLVTDISNNQNEIKKN